MLEHSIAPAAPRTARAHIDALNARARELREPDAQQGLELAQTAYDLAAGARYLPGMIAGLANQSHCYSWLSNFAVAVARGLEALRLAETLEACPELADVFLALARAHLHLANFAESLDFGQRALNLARQTGDRQTEADALNVLGINYYRSGKSDLAFSTYGAALVLHRTLNNCQGVCKVLVNIAQAHSTLGEYEQALTVGHDGLKIAREAQSRMLEAYLLHTLGQVYADKGAYTTALDYLEQSLPAADAVGNRYVRLVSMVAIGQVYVRNRQPAEATAQLMQALALAEQLNSKLYMFRCHEALAELYEHQAEWQQALAHYKQFHAIKEAVFNEAGVHRLQGLEIIHQIETARREAEIYHLRNVALEQEIAERKRLEAELLQQATTDVLTNVANRRHFLALARTDILHAIRHRRPLTLALIDLDHFKHINDTYGHAAGDRVLLTLAQTCKANIRPGDRFARFGGDEFVLLLPATTQLEAHSVVERIRRVLAADAIVHEAQAITLTISSGIAGLASDQETLDTLLARADQALYRAKQAGRNQVALAPAMADNR